MLKFSTFRLKFNTCNILEIYSIHLGRKALEGLKFVPNVMHLRFFEKKNHANLLGFGASFVKKSIAVGWRSKKAR